MEKLMIRNVLNKLGSIRVALAVGAGLPLIFVSNAFAQAPAATPVPAGAAGGEATAERVIVTGSNIPTAEETGPNPVDTYRPEDIKKLGIGTMTDLTQKLPAASGFSINENIANGGDGRVEINLRAIFPKETLVLMDGKRLAPDLNGAALGAQSVNINFFPFEIVDHIDILKDGASAIYGSDAVAGVFNVFLIHKFRGLEVGARYGNTNMGRSNDAAEEKAYMLAGTGDDKTDIVVFAELYNRAAIFSHDNFITSDANYRNFGGFDVRSSNFPGSVGSGAGTGFILNGGLVTPTPKSAANVSTSVEYSRRSTFKPEDQLFNFADLTPAIPAADREFMYGSFTHDICDKYLTVFADFKYVRTFFDAAAAPTPFTPDPFNTTAGLPNGGQGISVPLQNPFNPFTVSNTTTTFFGLPLYTGVKFRGTDPQAGNRTFKVTTNDYVYDLGLRGEMGEFGDYFKTWNWEGGFRYNEVFESSLAGNIVSKPGLREALADTNPATAFNPFTRGTNTAAAIARVFVTLHNTSVTSETLEYAKIDGNLFNLPAGPLGFALGEEHETQRYRNTPDSLNTTFSTIGSTDLQASKGNRDTWSTYGEVRIPVTSPTWNFPGLYSLEFDLAERYEYFSDFHNPAEKPKFSVRWQPLDTAWTIRASYNEAFHEPFLNELTPALAESFPAVQDPYAPAGTSKTPQIRTLVGGNPHLKPETAYEWSYGTVITPGKWLSWLTGLTMSADFWHIDMREAVSPFGTGFIIQNAGLFPGKVTRDGACPTGTVPGGPGCLNDGSGQHGELVQVDNTLFNLGALREEGLDWETQYMFETTRLGHGDWGQFTTTINGTYLARYVFAAQPGGKRIDETGSFLDFGSTPQNRMYASEYYDLGGLTTGATVHYVGQYSDPRTARGLATHDRKIREWVTLDLLASYTFNLPAPAAQTEVAGYAKDGGKNVKMKDGKDKNVAPVSTAEYNPCGFRAWLNGTSLTLGMNNVFDQPPPFTANGDPDTGYDPAIADIKGRFWYMELKKRF
jgi:iron complex outermembrane recepter protein